MNSSTSEFIDMNSFMHSYMNSAFVNIDSYSWNHRYEFICMNAYVNSSFAPWIHDYEFVYFLIHSYEFILWFNDMKSAVNSTYKHWIHHYIPNSHWYMNLWLRALGCLIHIQIQIPAVNLKQPSSDSNGSIALIHWQFNFIGTYSAQRVAKNAAPVRLCQSKRCLVSLCCHTTGTIHDSSMDVWVALSLGVDTRQSIAWCHRA